MRKTWIFLSIMTLGFFVGMWYLSTMPPEEEPSALLPSTQTDVLPETPASPMREVTLFVGNPDSGSLLRNVHEIDAQEHLLAELTQTIGYLLIPEDGNHNTVIPERTELLDLFLSQTGVLYLNFNKHLQKDHIGGLTAELATISSIVNTMLFNFKEIQSVQILIEGSEIDTLAGHVDCRKPFSKMFLLD